MLCMKCLKENERDARFCEHCGGALSAGPAGRTAGRAQKVGYGILAALVLAAAAVAGYYKFFLPGGIAAEVNGEQITIAEVDGVVRSTANGREVPPEMRDRMRSRVLKQLITERIAEQEAQKTGIRGTPDEVAEALARSRSSSGLEPKAFDAAVVERYGSRQVFTAALERQLTVRKYLAARITAGITDPALADAAVEQWLQGITSRAVVRVALPAQPAAGGCSCCNGGGSPGSGAASPRTEEARKAALDYWQKRKGGGPVETRITDLGCHVQIDIIRANTTAASLRYQNGMITEL